MNHVSPIFEHTSAEYQRTHNRRINQQGLTPPQEVTCRVCGESHYTVNMMPDGVCQPCTSIIIQEELYRW